MAFALMPLDRLRDRLLAGRSRLRYGVSALDQIALSLFNFGLSLYLVRVLSATDFGIVTLWMAMALLAVSVQGALVSGPLTIHIPAAADPQQAKRLADAVAVTNLLVIAVATAAVVAVNATVEAEWVPHDVPTMLAIPFFVAGGLLREYHRTLAFSRRDMKMLAWTDGPYLAVTTVCLAAMVVWPARFGNLAMAFFAMTIGCIVSQLFLNRRFHCPQPHPFDGKWLRDFRAIIGDVGWALVGVVATHLRSRSYIYVTVNLVSLAGLGALNLVGVLFRPVRLMLLAWSRTALPTMAAQLASGRIKAFDRTVLQAFAGAILASVGWFAVLWLAWHPIERYFLAGRYPDAWLLVWPWAIAAGLSVMEYTLSLALQAAREFKFLAYATLTGAPTTVAATAAAVLWHGYTWTMYGVAVGNFYMLAIQAWRLYTVRRRIIADTGVATAAASGLSS
ncbi:MAG TPA: oligosaccharide flippase family protein [Stellaceae bacterium]|jgi:O-antigen/teichoic acid export membrane protein|nr:oligosaccharide flippase family protein [Stellaceae bacterium]